MNIDTSTSAIENTRYHLVRMEKACLDYYANDLKDLRVPPGNGLEKLSGDRSGQHSIRINDQYRVCFVWSDGDAYDVDIVDYH